MRFSLGLVVAMLLGLMPQNDVIRVNTRLVQVDVVVRSKDGPVTNLTKEDFSIFDDGKPQRVDVFSISTLERSNAQQNQPALPPGVISNRAGRQLPTSATVILFDRLNTADTFQRQGHQQLLTYLKSARREDLTAIYVLGDDLKLIQDFTNDTDRLLRAATKMEIGDLPGVDNRTVPELAQANAVGRVTRRDVRTAVAEADFSVLQRTDPTEDAIEIMAHHLSVLPGRKSIIWMSGAGIPLAIASGTSRDGKGSAIDHATRALTAANIVVYPVDLRGLQAPDPPRGRRGSRPNLPPDVMIRLADGTGGRAFYNSNDLAGSIRAAIADSEVSYTLGFYLSDTAFDGKFHKLDVKVARKDVEVRHREGYFAVKEKAPDEKERRSIVGELLSSPFDTSQIGLQASVQPVQGSAGAFRIVLKIDAADLHLEQQNGRWTGIVDLAIRLESSKQKSVQAKTSTLDLPEEMYRAALLRGLTLEATVNTERPADRVRVVVQDRATGFAGSLWLPIARNQ